MLHSVPYFVLMILFLARRNDMAERIQRSITTGVKRCEYWSTANLNEVSNGNVLLT